MWRIASKNANGGRDFCLAIDSHAVPVAGQEGVQVEIIIARTSWD